MSVTPWIITAFTVGVVYLLDKWDNKFLRSFFSWIPAILLAYIIPAVVSASLNKSFVEDTIHEYSKLYFIPLAIVAVMSSLSIKQLKFIGWKPVAVFVSGSFWIALFPIAIAFIFLDSDLIQTVFLEQDYWKGIPPIVGSWIGGSTSQLVLKELVACPEHIFVSILVLDNILVNIWTILMFQGIKKSNTLNKLLGITSLKMPEDILNQDRQSLNPALCLAIFLSVVLLTNVLFDSFVLKIIALSFSGLLLGNGLKSWNFRFSLQFGSILILVVMAILGLKLTFGAFHITFGFLSFLIVWLASHFIFMLGIAKLLNTHVAWVPIASMANVGGIATAPAVTAAYEKKWMPHAILLAILSMATGTFWGMLNILLFKTVL